MTTLFAVELYLEPPEAESTALAPVAAAAAAAAVELVRELPAAAARRIAGAHAHAGEGLLTTVWEGLKGMARAAGRLMTIGFLVVSMLHLGRELLQELFPLQRSRSGGGRVLRFPGPQLEELS